MQAKQLLSGLDILQVVNNIPKQIDGVYVNSKQVKQGGLFVCISGTNADGHDFVQEAIKNGATAVVSQKLLDVDVCQVVVEDTHKAVSQLASAWHGFPAKKLKIICVVGTNGKTSTAVLTYKILSYAGQKAALISTNGIYIDEEYFVNDMTTPDPLVLNKHWADMVEAGVEFCVMEMSAHAIDQQKTFGNLADLAIFTNFSQDHLDYFGDMQRYGQVKKSFFDKRYAKIAVVNADDSLGQEIISEQKLPMVTYGIDNPADVFAVDINCLGDRSAYLINIYDTICQLSYGLSGKFNVYNTMAATTACRVFGIKPQVVAKALARVRCIEGRNQCVTMPNGARVVVDFAHTPEGFENILSHLRQSTFGRVITVFGCGGNRDKSKRKIMGEVASKYSDFIFVTSDNPRYEDPFEIMFEAQKGIVVSHQLVCDRQKAICKAMDMAMQDDVIAILGKGHEKYQEINGAKYPFCDMDVVTKNLQKD